MASWREFDRPSLDLPSQVQSMKQTNSSLRQALEAVIHSAPGSEAALSSLGEQEGPCLVAEQEREFCWRAGPLFPRFLSLKDPSLALQANTKFNSRWTIDGSSWPC